MFNKPVVLVAPLDWGLGHATRCIPLIRELLSIGFKVLIAAEGKQKLVLEEEFPLITFLQLPGYQVNYGRSAKQTFWKLILQVPGILSSIRSEHQWLKEKIDIHHIGLVISDNRFGLYNNRIPCIFITHQLLIKTSLGILSESFLQYLNYHFINKFATCWIPDNKEEPYLAGSLSHPTTLPAIPVEYIGPISRFQKKDRTASSGHMLFLLSGPEPQRTILENILLKQLQTFTSTATFIRGMPEDKVCITITNPLVKIHNHLPSASMHELMMHSSVIVCRSGYSSIMDLIPAGFRCAFIPTPGQPEQEYLATYLSSKGLCLKYDQEAFSIEKLQKDLINFLPAKQQFNDAQYKQIISKTLLQPDAGD